MVDFEGGVSTLLHKPINEMTKKELWSRAARTEGFYSHLPWTVDGKILWEMIEQYNPIILTAAPRGSWAEKQKREWVDRELGVDVRMIVSTRKYEECPPTNPPAILIDDKMVHCQAWEEAGGMAIFHIDAASTIYCLQDMGLQMDKTTSYLS